jgi:hypothetical protein
MFRFFPVKRRVDEMEYPAQAVSGKLAIALPGWNGPATRIAIGE